jgi:L-alanine-DL-glutamate epimerase-like enolase superfamily enzyme
MKISDIRATRVAVPLEAPLRHANGCRWGRFVRTIVEVKTDNGIVGLREMGGGESAEAVFRAMKSYFFEEIGNANQFPPPSRPGRLDAIFALAGRNLLLRMRS